MGLYRALVGEKASRNGHFAVFATSRDGRRLGRHLLAVARLLVPRLAVTLSGLPEAGGCPLAGGRPLTRVLRALAVPPVSLARLRCLRGRPLLVAARWRGRRRGGLLLVAGVPWAW